MAEHIRDGRGKYEPAPGWGIEPNNAGLVQDLDGNNRDSMNTVFGEKISGTRTPTLSVQFQYGIASDFATENLANGGTATVEDSLSKLATGTNAAGSAAIQTNEYLRYIPGHEAYMFFTMALTQGVANSHQRVGLYDDNDGFYLGYEGEDFCVSRMRDGVVEEKIVIDTNEVFVGDTFDPTKGNVYKISFGYLGFACISFEIMSPKGNWVLIHKFEYPNSENVTHITQTNLPARAEVTNTGNTTNLEFRSGSLTFGVVDGGGKDPSSRLFSASVPTTAITAGNFHIATFRVKDTFNGRENRIKAHLLLISVATELSKISSWKLLRNATITNTPTWNDVNTSDSIMEYSTDTTINFATGDDLIPWTMAKDDSFFEQVENQLVFLRPGETSSIVVITPVGTTGTVETAFRWKELF